LPCFQYWCYHIVIVLLEFDKDQISNTLVAFWHFGTGNSATCPHSHHSRIFSMNKCSGYDMHSMPNEGSFALKQFFRTADNFWLSFFFRWNFEIFFGIFSSFLSKTADIKNKQE